MGVVFLYFIGIASSSLHLDGTYGPSSWLAGEGRSRLNDGAAGVRNASYVGHSKDAPRRQAPPEPTSSGEGTTAAADLPAADAPADTSAAQAPPDPTSSELGEDTAAADLPTADAPADESMPSASACTAEEFLSVVTSPDIQFAVIGMLERSITCGMCFVGCGSKPQQEQLPCSMGCAPCFDFPEDVIGPFSGSGLLCPRDVWAGQLWSNGCVCQVA